MSRISECLETLDQLHTWEIRKIRKDGSVLEVDVLRSTGVGILDRYIENAIRFASPFPPIPGNVGAEAIPISVNFIYTIGGVRIFGFN